MAKKERRARIVCLSLSCLLLGLNISTVKAEALPEVMSGTSTVADCVMSYYAMSGAAVANTDFINTLYNDLGSNFGTVYDLAENGMLTINNDGTWQATSALTDAIANSSAYSSLGLDQMFNVSAEEAAATGGVAATGAGTLAGAVGGLASTGVLTVAAGVTGAYWGGIGIGTIASHAIEKYAPWIYGEAPITSNFNLTNGMTTATINDFRFTLQYGNYANVLKTPTPKWYLYIINPTDVSSVNRYTTNGTTYRDVNISSHNSANIGLLGFSAPSAQGNVIFDDIPDTGGGLSSHLTNAANGGIKKAGFSPDVIGQNGNQVGDYDPETGKYTVPDIKPQIDPGTQAGKPLTLQDWLDFANAVQNNNNNTDPVQNNTTVYNNIVQRIIVPKPQSPTPDPDPDPNPNPDPYTPPVVTPVPDPSLPDPVPDQNMSEEPQQSESPQETDKPLEPIPTGKPWMLPDLTKKFPFCIPWDIASCFSLLKSNVRQAPYISWHFVSPVGHVDYTFNLDLSDFDDAATLLRTLELIAFIVGLAFATRYLIGAS